MPIVENISVRQQGEMILKDVSWELKEGQQWAFVGPNGSGKSTFVKALWGGVNICAGRMEGFKKEEIGYVSFELQQALMEQEDFKDAMREYAGKLDEVTTAREVMLSATQDAGRACAALDVDALLDREVRALSTGQMRKILIARALVKRPKLLILDEPFDGLDVEARADFAETVSRVMSSGVQVILIAHRLEEIVPEVTDVAIMKEGEIFASGKKEEILTSELMSAAYDAELEVLREGNNYKLRYIIDKGKIDVDWAYQGREWQDGEAMIEFEDVTVRYGDLIVLDKMNWTMKAGENWAILGPNGSGKSTIVKLISGENVQGYANKIRLFGARKGSHESLWALRKRMGVVSGEMQVHYRKNMSPFDVVCSGFYDSIGLYRQPTKEQEEIAMKWIGVLGIEDLIEGNFDNFSYGQKRMLLLARAMVKAPELLILDEPCHGLDVKNRARILQIIEKIGETPTSILYITHHKEEILPCIDEVLRLEKRS